MPKDQISEGMPKLYPLVLLSMDRSKKFMPNLPPKLQSPQSHHKIMLNDKTTLYFIYYQYILCFIIIVIRLKLKF